MASMHRPWLSHLAGSNKSAAPASVGGGVTRVSKEQRIRELCMDGHRRNRHSHGDMLSCGVVEAGWKERVLEPCMVVICSNVWRYEMQQGSSCDALHPLEWCLKGKSEVEVRVLCMSLGMTVL
eukprot:scaffold53277_cov33-Tisochrysis_lutea.AAC.2